MSKVTTQTAQKMLKIVNTSNEQGKLIWLMIAFLHDTRASFQEIALLRVGDVYRNGAARKSVTLGEGQRRRSFILGHRLQDVVKALVLLPAQSLQITSDSPLFRFSNGYELTAEEMAKLFWLYQEAAEIA